MSSFVRDGIVIFNIQSQVLNDATPFAGANIALIKAQTDKWVEAEYAATATAGTAVETTIKEIVTALRTEIKSIWLDLTNLTANATIKLYHKIDGTNYKVFETNSWLFASDDKGVLIEGFSINNDFKITITGTEGAGVSIPYNIIYEVKEV